MLLLTQQLSSHLCLTSFMVDFPKPMEIPSPNSASYYSTIPLVPNNLSKQTVGAKYFAFTGGKEGLVCYEGQVV